MDHTCEYSSVSNVVCRYTPGIRTGDAGMLCTQARCGHFSFHSWPTCRLGNYLTSPSFNIAYLLIGPALCLPHFWLIRLTVYTEISFRRCAQSQSILCTWHGQAAPWTSNTASRRVDDLCIWACGRALSMTGSAASGARMVVELSSSSRLNSEFWNVSGDER